MIDVRQFEHQLTKLVACNSISSANPHIDQSNSQVIDTLANWLTDLGLQCQVHPVPDWPGKANLIATLGSGSGGLVLSGHTDTVPCDPDLWQQDPFALSNREHRYYGLGATDMKGFFPVVYAALERFKDQPLREPVIILATADEESSMCGARALVESQALRARYAVIGEPTGLRPIRMHKGIMFESIRIQGQSGHSSNPALGRNALETMSTVLNELLVLRNEFQSQYHNPHFEVPTPTLNLGCIHGGDNPNRICGSCEVQFDLRLLPGMDLETIRSILQTRLRPLAEKTQTDIVFHSLFPGIAPFEELATSTLVRAAEELTGQSSDAVAFATEAPFLQSLGMETLIMGPGCIDQAHQPNEYIDHSQIKPAVEVIANLIQKVCL